MYRMCLLGALMMIGACNMRSTRPAAQPAANTTAAPVPAPSTTAPVTAPTVQPSPPASPRKSTPHRTVRKASAIKGAEIKKAETTKAGVEKVAAPTSAQAQISGHVELRAARGQQVAADEQVDTLVYYVPQAGGARARPGHYTIYTHHRDFSPGAMAVPQGSTVTFVNLDDVRHNVFSVTPGAAFNLGYQAGGKKISHVFTHAGLVLVSCNVHHSMELDMLVIPSAYSVKVAADGDFTLSGLPAGSGTLHFWNPRAQPASQAVTLPMSAKVTQALQAIKPRMATTLNEGSAP